MRDNGSPPPSFEFDAARSYFRVTLPGHPEYLARIALQDFAYRKATGDELGALRGLQDAYANRRESSSLAAALVKAYAEASDLAAARQVVEEFLESDASSSARVLAALAAALREAGLETEAHQALDRLPKLPSTQDAGIF